MKFVANNPDKECYFFDKWHSELERLKRKNVKIPSRPGPGWLSGLAARLNLCTVLFKDESDNWMVCGRSLKKYPSESPYYCSICMEMLMKTYEDFKKESGNLADHLPNFEPPKEDDLPF